MIKTNRNVFGGTLEFEMISIANWIRTDGIHIDLYWLGGDFCPWYANS